MGDQVQVTSDEAQATTDSSPATSDGAQATSVGSQTTSGGTQATEQTPAALIESLVHELAHRDHMKAQAKESRRHERYPLMAMVTLCVQRKRDGEVRPVGKAYALELSRTGIGLVTEMELAPGKQMFLDLKRAGRTCIVPVRIVHCMRMLDHCYRTGAKFLFGES